MNYRRLLSLNASLVTALLLAACTQQMAQQPRYDPLEKSDFFSDTMSARPLPVGVVARDYVEHDQLLDSGLENGKPAEEFPFPITRFSLIAAMA